MEGDGPPSFASTAGPLHPSFEGTGDTDADLPAPIAAVVARLLTFWAQPGQSICSDEINTEKTHIPALFITEATIHLALPCLWRSQLVGKI